MRRYIFCSFASSFALLIRSITLSSSLLEDEGMSMVAKVKGCSKSSSPGALSLAAIQCTQCTRSSAVAGSSLVPTFKSALVSFTRSYSQTNRCPKNLTLLNLVRRDQTCIYLAVGPSSVARTCCLLRAYNQWANVDKGFPLQIFGVLVAEKRGKYLNLSSQQTGVYPSDARLPQLHTTALLL